MAPHPMLSALGRNKAGAMLIALQIAVTLAILCNAVYIIRQRLADAARPSGADEADDFVMVNLWVGNPPDVPSLIRADVAALRAIPSVADAYMTQGWPFNNGEMASGITLRPELPRSAKRTAIYFGDEHAMHTLGFTLAAGRNFSAADTSDFDGRTTLRAVSGMLVTRSLANQLAPDGKVLGHVAQLMLPNPIRGPIVGVIDTLQAPDVHAAGGSAVADNSVVLPLRFMAPGGVGYIVRTRPGRLAEAMRAAPAALASVSRQRVLREEYSLADGRRATYSGDRTLALMLAMVCMLLLAVTALGIIGMTSYWVAQRRRQIGIRRALGATRAEILRYFQVENVLISGVGIAAGVILALGGNLWIVKSFALGRMPYSYLVSGVAAMFALGQLAVLWPALRAASVPPTVATRSA